MSNALSLMIERDIADDLVAFYPLGGKATSFGELMRLSLGAQESLLQLGFQVGDSVLLADSISAEFYACVMAVLGLGGKVILVEPFLPISEIKQIIAAARPKVMIASWPGRIWGARVEAIRCIPHWKSARQLCWEMHSRSSKQTKIRMVPRLPTDPGILTFTSGTTGGSKGVVRTHAALIAQNIAIRDAARLDTYSGPDLAIFANLVLANLGMGRGTLFVPPKWKNSDLKKIHDLPPELKPHSLSAGPAFMEKLIAADVELASLRSIHIGGALTDIKTMKKVFSKWTDSKVFHVYGSSEAEPVAFSDARVAVRKSEERGFIQTLLLGDLIQGVDALHEADQIWVTGRHVCQMYLGNDEENSRSKRRDEQDRVWHAMGDRVEVAPDGLWYAGRTGQTRDDFILEQEIYSFLGESTSFIFRNEQNERVLSGENLSRRKNDLQTRFKDREIKWIQEKKIIRDRRHRARIDRGASR